MDLSAGNNSHELPKSDSILAIAEFVQRCRVGNKHVAISISGSPLLMKQVFIPTMPTTEIEEYLAWEGQQLIGYDLNELYWDFYHQPALFHGRERSSTTPVLIVAAKKQAVDAKTELVKSAGWIECCCDGCGWFGAFQ